MKNKLLTALLMGVITYSGIASAGVCESKPEAESVKAPLPVKFKNLKAENEKLKEKLDSCRAKKTEIKERIAQLKSQISQLESERAQLQLRLNSLPSKESLQIQIEELENRMGR